MIHRDVTSELVEAATRAPAVMISGPRQSGKTTLVRAVFPSHPYVNLEDPGERAFATEDPRGFLDRFRGGAVIDELQRVPSLLSCLQGAIDDDPARGRWILTGSQMLPLRQPGAQSLAGRTEALHLLPLCHGEVRRFGEHPTGLESTLLTGGYPRILDRGLDPATWLASHVAGILERDVRNLSRIGDLATFQRFLELCAGRTGQLLNYSSLARDTGVSQPTARAWLGILEESFIAFRLPAYFANTRKRLVRASKLHFYDTGLACWLLGIRRPRHLRAHPLRGAIFETWVVSEARKHRWNRGEARGMCFYRDRNGVEIDLVIDEPGRLALIESASSTTASSVLLARAKTLRRHFAHDSRRCEVAVAYGGDEFQQRPDGQIVPWRALRPLSLGGPRHVVSVFADGRAAKGVNVHTLEPDGTWSRAITDMKGEAVPRLPSPFSRTSVLVAADGFSAHVERNWMPAEQALHIELRTVPDGGSVVLTENLRFVPGLSGSLRPVRDSLGRTFIHTSNIAPGAGGRQPIAFELGDELRLTDGDGSEMLVRVIEILGKSALVEYRPC